MSNQDQWDDLLMRASRAYNLPFALLKAQMLAESGGDPQARSSAGALGLMQIMEQTAIGLVTEDSSLNNRVRLDPVISVMMGGRVDSDSYKWALTRGATGIDAYRYMLASYNAGPNAVYRAILHFSGVMKEPLPAFADIEKFLPVETQNYVSKIISTAGLDTSSSPQP